ARAIWLQIYLHYWTGAEYFSKFLENLKNTKLFSDYSYFLQSLESFQQKNYEEAIKKLLLLGDSFAPMHKDLLKAILYFELRNTCPTYYQELQLLSHHYPSCAGIQYLWALAASEIEAISPAELEDLFSQVLTTAPFLAEGYANWAVYLYERGKYTPAIELLDKAITLDEKQNSFFFNRGMIYLAQNKPTLAWKDFQQAQKLQFTISREVLQNLAHALLSQKQIQEAYEVANFLFTTENSLSPSELFLRSQLYCALGKWQEALKDLYALEKLYPTEPKILWQIACALQQLEKHSEALVYFLQLKPFQQEFPQLELCVASCYLEIGNLEQAEQWLSPPSNCLEYWLLKARLYEKQNLYEQSLEFLKQAPSTFLKDLRLILTQANLLLKLQRQQEAFSLLYQAIKEHPKNQELLLFLAQVEIEEGKRKEAKDHLLELLKQDENNLQGLHLIALLLAQEGKYEAAYEYYTRILNLSPQDPEVLANHANLAEILGNYNQALADLDAAIALIPYEAEFYLRKAEIYKILHDPKAAEEHLKMATILQQESRNPQN
ncbi:MAG: tetratricopeptide repeat protein, partial [Bacteroidia bacterium]|nr:tetratricopeptide repeat protein [Bacteroidia bacterium]